MMRALAARLERLEDRLAPPARLFLVELRAGEDPAQARRRLGVGDEDTLVVFAGWGEVSDTAQKIVHTAPAKAPRARQRRSKARHVHPVPHW